LLLFCLCLILLGRAERIGDVVDQFRGARARRPEERADQACDVVELVTAAEHATQARKQTEHGERHRCAQPDRHVAAGDRADQMRQRALHLGTTERREQSFADQDGGVRFVATEYRGIDAARDDAHVGRRNACSKRHFLHHVDEALFREHGARRRPARQFAGVEERRSLERTVQRENNHAHHEQPGNRGKRGGADESRVCERLFVEERIDIAAKPTQHVRHRHDHVDDVH
jgi:hypothetical protein